MKQIFYLHLVDLNCLKEHLKQIEMEAADHEELILLAHEIIHLEVTSVILKELPARHHSYYLNCIQTQPENIEILAFLTKYIPDLENKVKNIVYEIEQKLVEEIRSHRLYE